LEKRADVLSLDGDVKPDIASLTLSSVNFLRGASVNEPAIIRELAKIMLERGITPELELFDLGMVNACKVLVGEGLLQTPILANVFLGNVYSAQASALHLAAMTSGLPDNSIWSGAGIGNFNLQSYALALASGGGVRVGLEDGIHLRKMGERSLTSNEELHTRVVEMASLLDRTPMNGSQLKELLAR
jgi:uncharacterized protein (DUF849 family)